MAENQEEELRGIVQAVLEMEVERMPPDEGAVIGGRLYRKDEILRMLRSGSPLIQEKVVLPGVQLLKGNRRLMEKVITAFKNGDGASLGFLRGR